MPHGMVLPDSVARRVDAVAAVFGSLRDGGPGGGPADTTACPPRLRRVVAFMSANQAIPRVEDAPTAQHGRREVTDA